jgi:hypothetical protein
VSDSYDVIVIGSDGRGGTRIERLGAQQPQPEAIHVG